MTRDMPFNRQSLQQALHELGRRAYAEGKSIEIAIYGGSALILTYDWRIATRDVDAVFEADRQTVRRLAAEIADDIGWDRDWLNDGVKGFLSTTDTDPEARSACLQLTRLKTSRACGCPWPTHVICSQ
jgi:hypothetical protein